MKLIDVDEIKNELLRLLLEGEEKIKSVADVTPIIENAPTVDAVEVVRCKNCRFCYECSSGELRCEISYERANMDRTVTEDWFCADGEREA